MPGLPPSTQETVAQSPEIVDRSLELQVTLLGSAPLLLVIVSVSVPPTPSYSSSFATSSVTRIPVFATVLSAAPPLVYAASQGLVNMSMK